MGIQDLSAWVAVIVALIPLIIGLVKYGKKLWDAIMFLTKLSTTLVSLSTSLEELKKEFKVNSGSSVKDQLNRIEDKQQTLAQRVWAMNHDTDHGIFETNNKGELIQSNRTFLNTLGLDSTEALGNGWINSVSPELRDVLKDSWDSAVEDQREFSECIILKTGHKVCISALPVRSMGGELRGYVGTIRSKD